MQAETLVHEPLQPRTVDQIECEFLVRKHGERGAAGIGGKFGGFLNGEIGILCYHRHHHTHHDLEAAEKTGFLGSFGVILVQTATFHRDLPKLRPQRDLPF